MKPTQTQPSAKIGLMTSIVLAIAFTLSPALAQAQHQFCQAPKPTAQESDKVEREFLGAVLGKARELLNKDEELLKELSSCLNTLSSWKEVTSQVRLPESSPCFMFQPFFRELPALHRNSRIAMSFAFPPEARGHFPRLSDFESQVNRNLEVLPYWPFGKAKEPLSAMELTRARLIFFQHWDETIKAYIDLLADKECELNKQEAFIDANLRRTLRIKRELEQILNLPSAEQRAAIAATITDPMWKAYLEKSFRAFRLNQYKIALQIMDQFRPLAFLPQAAPTPLEMLASLEEVKKVRENLFNNEFRHALSRLVNPSSSLDSVRRLVMEMPDMIHEVLIESLDKPVCYGLEISRRHITTTDLGTFSATGLAAILAGFYLKPVHFFAGLSILDTVRTESERDRFYSMSRLYQATTGVDGKLLSAESFCEIGENLRLSEGMTLANWMALAFITRIPVGSGVFAMPKRFERRVSQAAWDSFWVNISTAVGTAVPMSVAGSAHINSLCKLTQPAEVWTLRPNYASRGSCIRPGGNRN